MDIRSFDKWKHDHSFAQDQQRPGERRTQVVILITVCTMVIEIIAGLAFGSMALLADGLHMASHAVALGLSVLAYSYARRHAHDRRFSFGTGKVNSLAGFTGAVLLAGFAFFMAIESVERFVNPVSIGYSYAIGVAILGLAVNGVSVLILGGHGHKHSEDSGTDVDEHHHEEDHNLRSAYLHVLADALTSVLAIAALLAGKFYGYSWLDPFMGVVGALLVANWSRGLLRQTARVLLDRQCSPDVESAIRNAIESSENNRVTDLHVWAIGPGLYATEIALISNAPEEPEDYKALLPAHLGLVHVTVEVHGRSGLESASIATPPRRV